MSQQQQLQQHSTPRSAHVAECVFEFLLAEILHWLEIECTPKNTVAAASKIEYVNDSKAVNDAMVEKQTSELAGGGEVGAAATQVPSFDGGPRRPSDIASVPSGDTTDTATPAMDSEELAIMAAEMAAAKIERMGFSVGYRLCERLAQTKPLVSGATSAAETTSTTGPAPNSPASVHLEAVKFLCKEFWTEVFRKQIDKLQTNHRGVFVLKDLELRWLRRLPSDDERSRVAAIKLLAFPCGLIRGALSNLGIAAVVSCDFLADGKSMASCSFNIKIKT